MVRFARRNANEPKRKHDSTKWEEMFEGTGESASQTDKPTTSNNYKSGNNFNNKNKKFNNNKFGDRNDRNRFDLDVNKFSRLVDKEVLDDLKKLKNQKKITNDEFVMLVKKEAKRNERRINRQQERQDTKVCFKCRKSGHSVQECPSIKTDSEQGTGICYKCGSTEHSVKNCKVKVAPDYFPFAKCFICNQTGHLSKQCPDNPRGLYPNGGSCKVCGSVEHYAKDCPENQKIEAVETQAISRLRPTDNVDELDEPVVAASSSAASTENKPKKQKIIKF